jgi:hypothetical protein
MLPRMLVLPLLVSACAASASSPDGKAADAARPADALATDSSVPSDAAPVVAGFTAARHWDGSNPIDWYPNGESGPHKGWELRLPYAGTVTGTATESPIHTPMYTAIITFDAPVLTANGQAIAVMWFTHVRQDVVFGHRNAGDVIAVCWDSGIEFENLGIVAEAAHIHLGASSTGIDPMGTGNISGLDAVHAMGYAPRLVDRIPGPSDYLTGRWFRGKAR